MIRKILIAFTVLSLPIGYSFAQGEMDAYNLSRTDLTGTARSVAMGGAFGALGGNISGVAINPAGIGVYKSSEIVTTLNFQNARTKTTTGLGDFKDNKFKFTFDNLAFVGTVPIDDDIIPYFNFGFSFNRLKSFDRQYTMKHGTGVYDNSLTDYMAQRAGNAPTSNWFASDASSNVWGNDWLPVLGYSSFLINKYDDGYYGSSLGDSKGNWPFSNNLFVKEKGSVNSYDFNFGTTFDNIISAGVTVSVTDINYHIYSAYTEDFSVGSYTGGFDLYNSLKTEGTGWQIGAGVIFKPVDELRIGVAYHSPTWYNMTDSYSATLEHELSALKNVVGNHIDPDYNNRAIESPGAYYDYQLRTPDRWAFSLAGLLDDNRLILSIDYELTNFGNMKLYDSNGSNLSNDVVSDPNTHIKSHYRSASTIRVGAEYNITPQLAVRAGYAWMQTPMKESFKSGKEYVNVQGSITSYLLDGDVNHITYGLGYRFTKNIYADLAFVMKSQKSDLYAFPAVSELQNSSVRTELKTETFQGLLTLGYRF